MNNAEKFKQIFGLYATELWSMPESDFLEWLNRDVETTQIDHTADIGKKVSISCAHENDLISRQAAIDALDQIFDRCEEIEAHLPEGDPDRTGYKMYPDYMTVWKYLRQLPSAQPEIIRCKDCKYWREHKYAKETKRYIPFCGFSAIYTQADDYCSKAERREE